VRTCFVLNAYYRICALVLNAYLFYVGIYRLITSQNMSINFYEIYGLVTSQNMSIKFYYTYQISPT